MALSDVSAADRAGIIAIGYALIGQSMEKARADGDHVLRATLSPDEYDAFIAGFETAIDVLRAATGVALGARDACDVESVVDFLRKVSEG